MSSSISRMSSRKHAISYVSSPNCSRYPHSSVLTTPQREWRLVTNTIAPVGSSGRRRQLLQTRGCKQKAPRSRSIHSEQRAAAGGCGRLEGSADARRGSPQNAGQPPRTRQRACLVITGAGSTRKGRAGLHTHRPAAAVSAGRLGSWRSHLG